MAEGASLEAARAAKSKAIDLLSRHLEVVAVGITRVDDGYGVKVNLSKALSPQVSVPPDIDGVPIVLTVVGRITKQSG